MQSLLLVSLAASDYPPWIWPKGCLPKDANQIDLFCPGADACPPSAGDDAYRCYNIPNLLRTGNGTLLAFVEGRKLSCKDQGYVDLLMRRSFDNGESWTHSVLLHGESNSSTHVTIGDAMPVWDARRQRVHLLFTRNNADVFYTYSSDHGATWGAPLNISGQINAHREGGNFIGTGHGAGIQTSSGRLILTLHGPCRTVFSDDSGASWHLGGSTAGGECSVAEAKPGVLVVTSRNGDDAVPRYTYIGVSYDDGISWNTSANTDLRSPIDGVEASIVTHPNGMVRKTSSNLRLTVFSAPGSLRAGQHRCPRPRVAAVPLPARQCAHPKQHGYQAEQGRRPHMVKPRARVVRPGGLQLAGGVGQRHRLAARAPLRSEQGDQLATANLSRQGHHIHDNCGGVACRASFAPSQRRVVS